MDETIEARAERLEAQLQKIRDLAQSTIKWLESDFMEAERGTKTYQAGIALAFIYMDAEQALNPDRNVWVEAFNKLPVVQRANDERGD